VAAAGAHVPPAQFALVWQCSKQISSFEAPASDSAAEQHSPVAHVLFMHPS
jgi:hypothetical protein